MESPRVERWLSLVANFSVVLGLIFVALEIRQTRAAVLSATYQSRATTEEEWEKFIAESDHIAPILVRARASSFSSLSPEDSVRLFSLSFAAFHRLDGLYYQHELGVLDDDYARTFLTRMFRVWVPRWRETGLLDSELIAMRPSFRREVEKYVDAPLIN